MEPLDDLDENPVPPPPSRPADQWDWAKKTFPVGSSVVFGAPLTVFPGQVPVGTKGVVVGHDRADVQTPAILVELYPPQVGTSPAELVAFDDALRSYGIRSRGVKDYPLWVWLEDIVRQGMLRPLTDTWGSGPAPLGRHQLPRSQRSPLKPNPTPPPPKYPPGTTPISLLQRHKPPAVQAWMAQMRAWMERTYPPGTPIETTEVLSYAGTPRFGPGARGTVVRPANDPDVERVWVRIDAATTIAGLPVSNVVGREFGISHHDMRPLGDHWASGGAPTGGRLSQVSRSRRLARNPVPPPPNAAMMPEWVERTFPVGTPMELERRETFGVVSEDELRDMLAHPPLAFPHARTVRLPASTRAEVVHQYTIRRALRRAPSSSAPSPAAPVLRWLFARVPRPALGLDVDPEIEEAFEKWDRFYAGEEMILALDPSVDFSVAPSPGPGRSRHAAVWWPLVDTWGPGSAPLGRQHIPRSQRSPLKPNPDDPDDDPEETVQRNARGAMDRARFGTEVDLEQGGKGAERYRIFHDKDPKRVVEICHAFPDRVGLAGGAMSVSYRTDKWHEDGDDTDYKHVFETNVHVYEPWGTQPWLEEAQLPRDYPTEPIALLGQCLGFFLRRVDDGEIYEVELPRARDCWLLAAPDGRMLFVYDPRVGFRAIFAGGRLSVEEEGIDH